MVQPWNILLLGRRGSFDSLPHSRAFSSLVPQEPTTVRIADFNRRCSEFVTQSRAPAESDNRFLAHGLVLRQVVNLISHFDLSPRNLLRAGVCRVIASPLRHSLRSCFSPTQHSIPQPATCEFSRPSSFSDSSSPLVLSLPRAPQSTHN